MVDNKNEIMIDNLINEIKKYNKDTNINLIRESFEFAEKAHENQKRNSGEPYIIHPYHVALLLTELHMDDDTIAAGLMHDVLEDTDYSYDDMKELFGKDITDLVDGVTKLKNIKYKNKQDSQAENIRKMIMAMSKDIRVIIIKLADRLHNMRTLEYMTQKKKIEKATETIEIYVPLAHRLGIYKIKWELEDLCLRYLEPEIYYDLVEKINKKREERENEINDLKLELIEKLGEVGINATIKGRPKSIYSIYKKISEKGKNFEQIFDLAGLRVLVDTVKDCYGALGIVHELWKPIPKRFKDYIAMPKQNMYQSLHTTVINKKGVTFEIQIRTHEMHKTSEYGIAAHWKYKEGRSRSTNLDDKLTWLRQIMEWQHDLKDPREFIETLKGEIIEEEVYVFSPKGDVVNLPIGATPIDFAYKVHTAVGNHCIGAKVDGKIIPLTQKLVTGNIVEILTASNSSGPSRDWLNIVKSSHARNKIKQWFKKEDRDINLVKGREMLEKEIRRRGYPFSEILKDDWLLKISEKNSLNTINDLFIAIGHGSVNLNNVVNKLIEFHKEYYDKEEACDLMPDFKVYNRKSTSDGVWMKDIENIKIKISKCCNPVPGDKIIGYITKLSGVSVHLTTCKNVINVDKSRLVEVFWDDNTKELFEVGLEIIAFDLRGYLALATNRLNENKVSILSMSARVNKDRTSKINLIIGIKNIENLNYIINQLKKVEGTLSVSRT